MKTIHLIGSIDVGGAERQLMLLAGYLDSMGIRQEIHPMVQASRPVSVPAGLRVVDARSGPASIAGTLLRIIRGVRKEESTVLVAWMYHAWLPALLVKLLYPRRVQLFLYCRHGEVASLKAGTRMIARASLRLASWLKIPVVFNGRRALVGHAPLTGDAPCFVIPNAVAASTFAPRISESGRLVIGYLGRNHPDKGADFLPSIVGHVLSAVPGSTFIAAGPGMPGMEAAITMAARDAGCEASRVSVIDAVDDVGGFMARIDVLLLPSRSESFPNVVVEAMSAGVLVAATSVGDVPDILGGMIETAGDPGGVAALAVRLCGLSAEERVRISVQLMAAVDSRYGLAQVAGQHLDLWRGIPRSVALAMPAD